ncbi:MAG: hypothetical protein V4594_19980 [Bacteroidota bacterium]
MRRRVLIKNSESYRELCWVSLRSNGNIGGYSSDIFGDKIRPEAAVKKDFHFFYPVNGNLHNSFKYKDVETAIAYRVYWDHYTVTKTLAGHPISVEKRLHQHDGSMRVNARTDFQVKRLEDPEFWFDLCGLGINGNSDFAIHPGLSTLKTTKLKSDDIVLDPDAFGMNNINIRCLAFHKKLDAKTIELYQSYKHIENSVAETRRIENHAIFIEMSVVYFS